METMSEDTHYFLSKYYIMDKIGEGAYGQVYRALDLSNRKMVALKTLVINESIKKAFLNEIQAQDLLSIQKNGCSKYVVCMYESNVYNPTRDPPPPEFLSQANTIIESLGFPPAKGIYPIKSYYLVQELMDGDLMQIIKYRNMRRISEDVLLRIMYDLLKGLEDIHSHNIAHQDIKPENILYLNTKVFSDVPTESLLQDPLLAKEHLVLKYGDLGLACSLEDLLKICGNNSSLSFLAPEFAQVPEDSRRPAFEFAKRGDLWALGLTLWSLVFGDHPFFPIDKVYEPIDVIKILRDLKGKTYFEVFPKIYGSPETDEKAALINTILKSLLEINPSERIDAGEIAKFIEDSSLLKEEKSQEVFSLGEIVI